MTHASGARACNAHARRKIFDARVSDPLLASRFLAIYQELYDIEDRGTDLVLPGAGGLACRGGAAGVAADAGVARRRGGPARLAQGQVCRSPGLLRNQWDALQVYLGDGRLPIDNNETEQLMKQVAIGRKNWLFVGSVAAGERAADFFTIVSSAVRNDLDVWAYVRALLDRLLAGDRDYAALRPDCWASSHPEHVRIVPG